MKRRIERIVEIGEAVEMVSQNEYLEGLTAFKIGLIGDRCKEIIARYNLHKGRILTNLQNRVRIVNNHIKEGMLHEYRIKLQDQIAKLEADAQDKIDTLNTYQEEINIPPLFLSEFIAKKDIREVVIVNELPEIRVVIHAGQTLVPVGFFTLMGNLIKDDVNLPVNENQISLNI